MCDDIIDPLSCERAKGWSGFFGRVHVMEDVSGAIKVCFVGVAAWVPVVQSDILSKEEGYEEE